MVFHLGQGRLELVKYGIVEHILRPARLIEPERSDAAGTVFPSPGRCVVVSDMAVTSLEGYDQATRIHEGSSLRGVCTHAAVSDQ